MFSVSWHALGIGLGCCVLLLPWDWEFWLLLAACTGQTCSKTLPLCLRLVGLGDGEETTLGNVLTLYFPFYLYYRFHCRDEIPSDRSCPCWAGSELSV